MEARELDALIDRHRDRIKRLLREIVAEESGPNPFSFSLSRYRELSDARRAELVRRAGIIARERVDEELRRRDAAWIVLLGDRVIASSGETADCPDAETLLAMGEPTDRVPFLFEAALIEELTCTSSWSPLRGDDSYPTLPLAVNGLVLTGDLDTGSHATLLSASHPEIDSPTWFEGRHLGQPFLWAPAMVSIGLRLGSGDTLERSVAVRMVRDWATSPFTRINSARQALVGRDLLRAFGLTVTLSTAATLTTVVSGK